MNKSRFYPEPPHVSAAFYLDSLDPRDGFAALCQQVIASGARPTGAVEFVRSTEFPHFAMISDLAPQLEWTQLKIGEKQGPDACRQILEVQASSERQVLCAAFETPRAGLAVVTFGPIPDDSGASAIHPIVVTLSGSSLSVPSEASLGKADRQRALATAKFLMLVFRSVCESLDPLYGGIVVEASLPLPDELANGTSRLGTELFVSARLEGADSQLERDMANIFTGGFSERWTTGVFFSGWAAFNPDGHTVDQPLGVGALAARRLARALKMSGTIT